MFALAFVFRVGIKATRPSSLGKIRRISNSDFTVLVTSNGGRVPRRVGAIFGANGIKKRRAYRHIGLASAPRKKISNFDGHGFGNTLLERDLTVKLQENMSLVIRPSKKRSSL